MNRITVAAESELNTLR